jgi:hypothetical protein
MAAVLLLFNPRQQRTQGFRNAAHNSQVDMAAASQLLSADVDLHDARILRIEPLIRKIRSQHHQRLAVHHGVVAGREPEQANHAHVVRVVVLDKLLPAQGMNDGSL